MPINLTFEGVQPQERVCTLSGKTFSISAEDIAAYKTFQVPLPTLCPEERARRRLQFRNERQFYPAKCHATQKPIISIYAPDSPYTVYDKTYWWSDAWDARQYGRDYDPSRSFFEQFHELLHAVPHQNVIAANNENSDYGNMIASCNDCYMLVEASNNERCLHCYWIQNCTDCMDCSFSSSCELGYDLDNCRDCFNLRHSWDSRNCSNSTLLRGCRGVHDSIGCVGMQNVKHCIMNQQYSPEEFKERAATLDMTEVQRFVEEHPQNYDNNINIENSSGTYLENVRNCHACIDASDAEDCRYGEHLWRGAKNIMDASTAGRNAELEYEVLNCAIDTYDIQFSVQGCINAKHLRYCYECYSSENLFGCVGMRKAQYCILNKQYSKEEYEALRERIINDMLARGEYGEFFPAHLSPFAYNETAAQDSYPMSQEETQARGYRWKEQTGTAYEAPLVELRPITAYGDIAAASELLNSILRCKETGKAYKIVSQELALLLKLHEEIPTLCPDARFQRRKARRNQI